MSQKAKLPDRQILQKVTTQLPRRGIRPPCDVHVSVQNGIVTLTGKIEFELQRKAAIHAAHAVNGVQRVVDQMSAMHSTIGGWHAKTAAAHHRPAATPHHTQPSPQVSGESPTPAAEPPTTQQAPVAAPQGEKKS